MAGKVNVQVGFSVDKSGLSEMQSLFQQIAFKAAEPGNKMKTGLQEAAKTATTLDNILTKTFNTDLGSLNVTKFNQELSKSGLSLKDVKANLSQAGNQGVTAFNRLSQAILGTNQQIKQSSKLLDDMFTTFKNTIRYGISSSIFNNFANSIQRAFDFTKQLDKSLNDIRIVTDKSAESMEKFAQQANEASKGMGASTLDYTNAALIYYQQGLSDSEVQARAETTIKAANVTGQAGEEVSEQLTAVWNGYKVSAEETELYVDKLAAVAATTAADLEELSVGMSKVASAANAMGVDFDDLNAQIATIVSVTRQAPESVGTALKTIYARMGDLSVEGGVDEFGVSLGKVSEQMEMMGVQILDQSGNLRNMSDVIADVAKKWDGWTEAQKQAAAVAMAGKRQYNNLIALFDNWDMYTNALETSTEAMGTLQHQQDIYMESTTAKLKTLKAAWQGLYDDAINEDEINGGIEALTNLVEVFDNFVSSFGGGLKTVAGFGAILSSVFNRQIAESIVTANQRLEVFKNNLALAQAQAEARKLGTGGQLDSNASAIDLAVQANSEKQLALAKEIYNARIGLNQEQTNSLINLQKEIGGLEQEITLADSLLEKKAIDADLTSTEIDKIKNYSMSLDDVNSKYGLMTQEIEIGTEKISQAAQIINTQYKAGLKDSAEIEVKIADILATIAQETNVIISSGSIEEKELQKILNLVQQSGNASGTLKIYQKQILDLINKIKNEYQQEYQNQLKRNKAAQDYVNILTQQRGNKEQQNNKELEAKFMLDAANAATNLTQNIMTVTSALGNMAMAWSAVNSLIDTWHNKEASFGDKLLQTFMTLGMTLPMVYSNFKKLNEVFGINTLSLKSLTAQKVADELATKSMIATSDAKITREEADIALDAVKRKNMVQNIASQTAYNASLTEEEAILQIKEIAKTKHIMLSDKEALAVYKEVVAHQANTVALEAETTAQEAANTAMLANPIGIIIAALTALVAVIGTVVTAYDNYNKKILENARISVENVKKKQAEIDANEELYQSYKKALFAYEEGIGSREDLKLATEKVCDAYDIEISKLDILNEKYDKVTAAIKAKRNADLQESKTLLETGEASQEVVALQQSRKGRGRLLSNYKVDLHSYNPFAFSDENLKQVVNQNVSAEFRRSGNDLNFQYKDFKEMVQLYDELSKAKEEYLKLADPEQAAKSADYKVFNEWLERVGPEIESQREIEEQLRNTNAEILVNNQSNFDKVTNLKEYREELEKITVALVNQGSTEENAIKIANKHVGALNDTLSELQKESELLDEILDRTNIDESELTDWVDSLSDSEKEILFSGKIIFDGKETIKEIENALNIAQNQVEQEDLGVVVSLREKMTSDKKLTKKQLEEAAGEQSLLSEEYGTLLADFDDSSRLSQLETLNQIVEDKIQLNQEYVNSIRELTAAQYESDKAQYEVLERELQLLEAKKHAHEIDSSIPELTKEENERYEELIVTLSNLNEQIENEAYLLEEGFNQSLDNTIFDGLIAGIDGVISKADLLKELAEEVGESWTIASNDIEDFASNFPELIASQENYNILQDGSLQLTEKGIALFQDQVQLRQADLNQSLEAYKIELQKQADIQNATAAYYKQQAQYIRDYLTGKSSAVETEKKMEQAKTDYFDELMKITGQNNEELNRSIQQNLNNTNVNAEGNAQDIYNYWCSVGEAAKLAGMAYENKEFNPPGFNSGSHKSGVNVDSYSPKASPDDAESKWITQTDKDKLVELMNDYEKMAKDAENEAAKANARIAKATSSVTAANKAMQGAASGAGGKESKSKSGGGSKDKQKKDKELKKLEDEIDRYWELNKAIDAVDRALKKIDRDQEKLYGKELINSLQKENELLGQQREHYEQLYQAQQQEAAELRGQLSGMGVAFDESSGAILNYAEAVAAALATYNAAVAAFNAGPQDEAAQKSLEAAEKAYENFKKLLERYDTLVYTEMQQTQEKIEDTWRKELENNLKAWETEIQLKLDMEDIEEQWNQFLQRAKKDFKKHFSDITIDAKTNYDTGMREGRKVDINKAAIEEVEAEIDKMKSGGQSNMFESISQAQEKLKELNDEMIASANAVGDAYENAISQYLEGIDQVKEKFEQLTDIYDRATDNLNYNRQLVELLYNSNYELMNKYYEAQEKANYKQLNSLKQQKEFWKEQLNATGAAKKQMSEWNEDELKYYNNMIEAEQKLHDLEIDNIKLAQERRKLQIDEALKGPKEQLKEMKEEWEKITKFNDKYYDGVESVYEIQKLSSKYDQSIAQTRSLIAQQKLNDLKQEELNRLREAQDETNALSKYEVQRADLRYQLALREIALEEAQNSKTDMKLTRDEQGNWTYQYIADDTEIETKRQEMLDALNDLYQLSSEAYEKSIEDQIALQEEYITRLEEIYEDTALSDEERVAKLDELNQWYYSEADTLAEENATYQQDLRAETAAILLESYEADEDALNSMTDEEKQLVKELTKENIHDYKDVEKAVKNNYTEIGKQSKTVMEQTRKDWNSAAQQAINEWHDNKNSVKAKMEDTYDKIQAADEEYRETVDETARQAGADYGKEGIEGAINNAQQATEDLDKATEELCRNGSDYLETLRQYVESLEQEWQRVQQEIRTAIDLLREYLQLVGEVEAAERTNAGQIVGPAPTSEIPKPGGGSVNAGGGGGSGSSTTEHIQPTTHWIENVWVKTKGNGKYDLIGRSDSGVEKVLESNKTYTTIEIQEKIKQYKGRETSALTGGYTGEWNNGSDERNGRLAFLHQKELVLNADDTKNFLSGINTIRSMVASNGSIETAVLRAAANMASTLGNISPGTVYSGGNVVNNEKGSDNIFNITAEFPNANNVNEIREAILTLPNLASQFIHTNLK